MGQNFHARMNTIKNPVGRPPKSPDASASSWVQIRVTRRRKAAWVRAATPGKLTQWIHEQLDKAANYQEGQ